MPAARPVALRERAGVLPQLPVDVKQHSRSGHRASKRGTPAAGKTTVWAVSHLAISVVGRDGPGIVAALAGVLMEQGCNLEDGAMTILGGHFAMMMLVDAPPGLDGPGLEAALSVPSEQRGLAVSARSVSEVVVPEEAGEAWTVSVHGADHPGIVHQITASLAEAGANVVDMTTRVIGQPDEPVYVMVLDVLLPAAVDGAALEERLDGLSRELAVACVVHPAQPDIL